MMMTKTIQYLSVVVVHIAVIPQDLAVMGVVVVVVKNPVLLVDLPLEPSLVPVMVTIMVIMVIIVVLSLRM